MMGYSYRFIFKFINAPVVIVTLTTIVFISIFIHEYRSLQEKIKSIAENGKSALFQEEYINQVVASHLSRAFSVLKSSNQEISVVCKFREEINNVTGLNLSHKTFPGLAGTLQARNAECLQWAADIPALVLIQGELSGTRQKYSFSNYAAYRFNNTRYYMDIIKKYIYVNHLIDTGKFIFNNWLLMENGYVSVSHDDHTLNIDNQALYDLSYGESIVSHVYYGRYTERNIISLLTPVFKNGVLKGVLVSDFTINDLAASFYTRNRPVLWQFLSLYITDNLTGKSIPIHAPYISTYAPLKLNVNITDYYTLHVKLDFIYFILNTLWILIIYILSSWGLCHYSQRQINKYMSISLENVTDTITTLYNRKILNLALDEKLKVILKKTYLLQLLPLTAMD